MRRYAHSNDPERWKQVDLLGRLIVNQAERGKFPLYEAGTSLQEIQKLKMLIADEAKKRARAVPTAVETEAPAIVPIGEAAIELEAMPDDEALELDRAACDATAETRWRGQFTGASDACEWPTVLPPIRLNPTAVFSTTMRAAEVLPHEWRDSHEESLLANFDALFNRTFKA